jgi:glucosamine--fructose-6-phosphate aminotransferase (isomerizing)
MIAAHECDAAPIAALLAKHDRAFIIARGLHYATAREIALKLTETVQLLACPLTATDLVHGPIAALERPFPVWAIGGQDSSDVAVKEALERAHGAGAPTILTAPTGACLSADLNLPTAPAPSPLLAPLSAVISDHIVAHAAAQMRGLELNRPSPLLTKVPVTP